MSKVSAGGRFGKLLAVRPMGRATDGHVVWEMLCDCGSRCLRQTNNLHADVAHSCGCFPSKGALKHGMKYTREYNVWSQAKARCYCPTNKDYHRYGARGITMCDRWYFAFEAFYVDMGRAPKGAVIDRVDNNGPYSPSNCRWASASQSQRNKTTGWRVFINDLEFDSLTAAAQHFGRSITTIQRWCRGYHDPRRNITKPPLLGCRLESLR